MAVETLVIKPNPVTQADSYTMTAFRREDVRTHATLAFDAKLYESEERTEGGPWGMKTRLYARENILLELFEGGLQRLFQAWGYGLTCSFEGLAHQLVLVMPPNIYVKSMDPVFNSVLMRADVDGDNAVERVGPFTDQDSIDRWHTLQRVLSGGQVEGESVAEQAIKVAMELSKQPKFEPDLFGAGSRREMYLEVFVRGMAWTLNNEVYNQTANTGTQSLTDLVDLLIGERASVVVKKPSTFQDVIDLDEGRPTDADALSPDWDHTVLEGVADFDSEVDTDGDLNTSSTAKIGSSALGITFDDGNDAYGVIHATAVDRTEFTADLWVDRHTLSQDNGSVVQFLRVVGNRIPALVEFFPDGSGNPRIRYRTQDDSSTLTVGTHTLDGAGGNVHVRIVWQQASGAGNDDGFAYMLVDDNGTISTYSSTGLDNDTVDWDEARVGMAFTNSATFGGAYRIDEVRISESVSPVWITEAAARDGSYGVAITIEDQTARYLEDTDPAAETEYVRELKVNPTLVDMADGDEFVVVAFRDDTAAVDIARLVLKRDDPNYVVYPQVRTDGGTYTDGDEFTLYDTWNTLRLHLLISSGAGNDDGRAYAFIENFRKVEITGIDNDTLVVDRVRLGAVSGLDAGTSGVLKLDTMRGSVESLITVTDESGLGDYFASKQLDSNPTTVAEEFDSDQRPWDIIANHIQVGDNNLDRWTFHAKTPSITDVDGRKAVLEKTAPRTPPPVES